MLGGGVFRNWSTVFFFLQICRSESAIKFVDLILYYQLILLRFQNCKFYYRPVGQAVTRSSLEREVRGSNLWLVKSNTVLPTGAMTRRWALQTRYTLRRNTASIMKDLIWYFVFFLAATRVDLWGRLTLVPPIIPFTPAKRNCKSQEFRFCCCWTFSGFSDIFALMTFC